MVSICQRSRVSLVRGVQKAVIDIVLRMPVLDQQSTAAMVNCVVRFQKHREIQY